MAQQMPSSMNGTFYYFKYSFFRTLQYVGTYETDITLTFCCFSRPTYCFSSRKIPLYFFKNYYCIVADTVVLKIL
jgi:hypothetical protein